MSFDPLQPPPLLTADLPGCGGVIKSIPEDFEVEEIPAYEPSGTGDFLYLWVEKRDMGAEFFVRDLAKRLGLAPGDIGTAGLKDRRAVTRQWVSVPATCSDLIAAVDGEGVRILTVNRHGNKLKTGHLRGNRFRILIREVDPEAAERVELILNRIRNEGLPNIYGAQRFGHDGETVLLGMSLLRNESPPVVAGRRINARSPFLRKLALSAAQSALFNHYLARRMADGLLRKVLLGDVMAKWPVGGLFVVEDVPREQSRLDLRETVSTGPIFGRKTFSAAADSAAREEETLEEAGLTRSAFHAFGKLMQGTRRHNFIYPEGLIAVPEAEGIRLSFTLPAGSYATVLLSEVMKAESADVEAV
jgi:tRNA pseudouridine13 synthase